MGNSGSKFNIKVINGALMCVPHRMKRVIASIEEKIRGLKEEAKTFVSHTYRVCALPQPYLQSRFHFFLFQYAFIDESQGLEQSEDEG